MHINTYTFMYKHIHTHIYMSIHIFTYSYISIVSIYTYPLYPFIHIHCLHTYIYAYIHTYIHILFAFHWVLKPHEWHAYFAIPSATSPSNDLSRSFWCIPHCLTPWELFVMQPIHPCLLFFGHCADKSSPAFRTGDRLIEKPDWH